MEVIEPTEPVFLLSGGDPLAHLLVLLWAYLRDRLGRISQDQFAQACLTAGAMEQWARDHGQDVDKALQVWADTLLAAAVELHRVSSQLAACGHPVH